MVTILPSGGSSDIYTVANTRTLASVTILDDDIPTSTSDPSAGISIVAIEESVAESATADFQVTAKSASSIARTIRVEVDDGSGEFIDVDDQRSEYNYDKATKIFLVTIPANQQTATLSVILDDDSKNEANGTITATVLVESDPTPTYSLASTHISATVTAEDNDSDVPILSISSPAAGTIGTGVTEGFSFKFKVRASEVISGSDLPIVVSADDGTASLGLSIAGANKIPVGSQEAEFTVTMAPEADVLPGSDINIVVTLAEHDDYDTNPNQESISIKVKDNDTPSTSNPTITITGPHYVAEGSTFNFTVTASHPPSAEITVNVDVKPAHGNFLAANQGGIRTARIASGASEGTVAVGTVIESATGSDGRISAEVLEGKGYALTVADAPRNTEVVIYDALPVISLTAPESAREADGKFDITLTSNIVPLVNHPITITTLDVDDSTGQSHDYFGSIPTEPIIIDHNSVNGAVNVRVTLNTNGVYDGWGEITASLTNGLNYTADPNENSKSIEIEDDGTAPHVVSISAPVSVVEGGDIEVKLTASPELSAGESLSVDLQVENEDGSYLNYTSVPITITDANSSSTTISIPTHDDTTRDINGAISLEVMRADGYEPGSPATKNVTVLDKAELPLITITAENAGPIDEGETAVFTLSATPNPTAEIMVSVKVEHAQGTTGNFILPADKKTHQVRVSTAGSGRLEVRTVADTVLEANGTIQATLIVDPLGVYDPSDEGEPSSTTYLIGPAPVPASVAITDNDRTGVPSVTRFQVVIQLMRETLRHLLLLQIQLKHLQ